MALTCTFPTGKLFSFGPIYSRINLFSCMSQSRNPGEVRSVLCVCWEYSNYWMWKCCFCHFGGFIQLTRSSFLSQKQQEICPFPTISRFSQVFKKFFRTANIHVCIGQTCLCVVKAMSHMRCIHGKKGKETSLAAGTVSSSSKSTGSWEAGPFSSRYFLSLDLGRQSSFFASGVFWPSW